MCDMSLTSWFWLAVMDLDSYTMVKKEIRAIHRKSKMQGLFPPSCILSGIRKFRIKEVDPRDLNMDESGE